MYSADSGVDVGQTQYELEGALFYKDVHFKPFKYNNDGPEEQKRTRLDDLKSRTAYEAVGDPPQDVSLILASLWI
jgi:hypothetical protein